MGGPGKRSHRVGQPFVSRARAVCRHALTFRLAREVEEVVAAWSPARSPVPSPTRQSASLRLRTIYSGV